MEARKSQVNAKKTKIKPKISVVLKESPLLSMKKEESKEENTLGDPTVNPFPIGKLDIKLNENQENAQKSEREFSEADENPAEETKDEDSNPFGEAVSSGRNSTTCGK